MRLTVLLLALGLATPALAQDSPQGIAFAQAEEGTWLCRHENAQEAMSCAREHCSEQAPGQDCYITAWCFPGGWSGYMTFWLPDFHTTQVLCGLPNEAGLRAAFQALCASDDTATSCDLVAIIDPEGNERLVEGVSFAGGAAPPPVETTAPEVLESDQPPVGGPEPPPARPDSDPPAADENGGGGG